MLAQMSEDSVLALGAASFKLMQVKPWLARLQVGTYSSLPHHSGWCADRFAHAGESCHRLCANSTDASRHRHPPYNAAVVADRAVAQPQLGPMRVLSSDHTRAHPRDHAELRYAVYAVHRCAPFRRAAWLGFPRMQWRAE